MKGCTLRQKLSVLIRKPHLRRTSSAAFFKHKPVFLFIGLASVRLSMLTTLYTFSVEQF